MMIVALNLDRYTKARVWWGELPDLRYNALRLGERTLEAQGAALANARCAAVELFIPTGTRFLYGILGAAFSPVDIGRLLVQVAVSAEDGERVATSLAGRVDDVRVGLPQEYTEAVLEGATGMDEIHRLGPGVVRFDVAAHGRISSAQVIFRRLARTVMRLLCLDAEPASEEELRKMLEREE
jgi:hypothetical protein